MPGLRLVLSMGMPGPWGESAKAILNIKGIPFIPVGQEIGGENQELRDWTGFRNAPIAAYESERPVDRWLDILMLAERIKPEPSLLPQSSPDRALVMGISSEICSEWGIGWARRIMMMDQLTQQRADDPMRIQYRHSAEASATAPARCADILKMLVDRLKAQETVGSPYLVGTSLTVADIYWACFSIMIDPLPMEDMPVPESFRPIYLNRPPILAAVTDPILFKHRQMIFQKHLKLPMNY